MRYVQQSIAVFFQPRPYFQTDAEIIHGFSRAAYLPRERLPEKSRVVLLQHGGRLENYDSLQRHRPGRDGRRKSPLIWMDKQAVNLYSPKGKFRRVLGRFESRAGVLSRPQGEVTASPIAPR